MPIYWYELNKWFDIIIFTVEKLNLRSLLFSSISKFPDCLADSRVL